MRRHKLTMTRTSPLGIPEGAAYAAVQRAPEIPTETQQFSARLPADATLRSGWFWLFAVGVWSLTLGVVHLAQDKPIPRLSWQVVQTPLPVAGGKPVIRIALEDGPAPQRNVKQLAQDLENDDDTLELANHVVKELVADELQSLALKLSLSEQVARHTARRAGIKLPEAVLPPVPHPVRQ